jgi:chorismate mutase
VLVHCYADGSVEPKHVYLREAVSLRKDLQGAQ